MRPAWTGIALLMTATASAVAGYWLGSEPTIGIAPTSLLNGAATADVAAPPPGEALNGFSVARTAALPPAQNLSSPATIGQLIEGAASLGAPHDRDEALVIAFERLVELDPTAALARAHGLDPASARRFVPEVIGAWSGSDLEAATQAAFVLEPASLRFDAAREILRRRADLSPAELRQIARRLGEPEASEWLLLEARAVPSPAHAAAALAEAVGMAGQPRRHERLDRIARLIALQSPADALALADDIKDSRDRVTFQKSVAATWAETDPLSAAQWLEGQPARVRRQLASAVAAPFARRDPGAALDWAGRVDAGAEWGAWTVVLATIAETDPVMAVETALAADAGRRQSNGTVVALAFLARKDPQLAATYLERIPGGKDRSEAMVEIALQMARQDDPVRALSWLAERKGPESRHGRLRIAVEWAYDDPEAAFAFADRLPRAERGPWINAVVHALVETEPDRMVELIMSRSSDPDFAQTLVMAAQSIGPRDPDLALALSDELSDPRQRDQVLSSAIPQLAQRSPKEAVAALERIADEEQRASVVQLVTQIWAQSDPDAAFGWVRSLPAGRTRDQSFAALVPSMTSLRDMESAIDRIRTAEVRHQAVAQAAFALVQNGKADEARELVFRHPLDPAMMQMLETQLRDTHGVTW